jgi:hypothetical protein
MEDRKTLSTLGVICPLSDVCGASGNTLYWVLLLVYVGPWATHYTGSDVDLQQWTIFGEVEVSTSVSPPKPLIIANNTLANKIICHYFPIS